ncbi:MAG: calcium-binding protein, partial [Roseovarius sp.]
MTEYTLPPSYLLRDPFNSLLSERALETQAGYDHWVAGAEGVAMAQADNFSELARHYRSASANPDIDAAISQQFADIADRMDELSAAFVTYSGVAGGVFIDHGRALMSADQLRALNLFVNEAIAPWSGADQNFIYDMGINVNYAGYKAGDPNSIILWERELNYLRELHYWQGRSLEYQAIAEEVKEIADQSRDLSTDSEKLGIILNILSTGAALISLASSTTWLGAARVVGAYTFSTLTGLPTDVKGALEAIVGEFASERFEDDLQGLADEFSNDTGTAYFQIASTPGYVAGVLSDTLYLIAPNQDQATSLSFASGELLRDVENLVIVSSNETDDILWNPPISGRVLVQALDGNDRVVVGKAGLFTSNEIVIDGGDGNDRIDIEGVAADLSGGQGDDEFYIRYAVSSVEGGARAKVDGGAGNDSFSVDHLAMVDLTGGEGRDTLDLTDNIDRLSDAGTGFVPAGAPARHQFATETTHLGNGKYLLQPATGQTLGMTFEGIENLVLTPNNDTFIENGTPTGELIWIEAGFGDDTFRLVDPLGKVIHGGLFLNPEPNRDGRDTIEYHSTAPVVLSFEKGDGPESGRTAILVAGAQGMDELYSFERIRLTTDQDRVIIDDLSALGNFGNSNGGTTVTIDGHDDDDFIDFDISLSGFDPKKFALVDGQLSVAGVKLVNFETLRDLSSDERNFFVIEGNADLPGEVTNAHRAAETVAEGVMATKAAGNFSDGILAAILKTGFKSFGSATDVIAGGGNNFVVSGEGSQKINLFGGDGDDVLTIQGGQGGVVNGGEGNDWVLASGAERVVTIGGVGRDAILNASRGGIIYGDTYSTTVKFVDDQGVLQEEEVDQTAYENSDKIWYYSGTTMMDPGESDYLALRGVPLVGGTAGLPIWFSVSVGGAFGADIQMIGDGGANGIYFDQFIPWIVYSHQPEDERLLVTNMFSWALDKFPIFSGFPKADEVPGVDGEPMPVGAMVFENYDNFSGHLFGWNLNVVGDLSMSFKQPNAAIFAALKVLSNVLGTTTVGWVASAGLQLLPMLDLIFTTYNTALKIGKNARWAAHEDPLIIDLDGDGIETVSRDASGVFFDMDGDFFRESTGWVAPDDGFLAYDKDGNGRIDDIDELFGNVGLSGIDELASYDLNGDGVIDAADAIYSELSIWQDLDQDGETDAGELSSLEERGIVSIELTRNELGVTTPQGTILDAYTRVHFEDGFVTTAYDSVLELNHMLTEFAGESGTAAWLQNDDTINMRGVGNVVDLSIAMSNDFELAEIVARDAPAMTVPDLKVLREQASEALSVWGMVLERSRELTPVLTRTDADGTALVDRGVYVEDATGGYWTLASGADILDGEGAAIARPTLQDVMAQAAGANESWALEQVFSASSRAAPLEHRENAPYLAQIVDGRVVVHDYGVQGADGVWSLASGADVLAQDGGLIAAPTIADILAQGAAEGLEWRLEDLQHNPLAELDVEAIGIYVIDEEAVDYTVQVTDRDGSFHVWARNLDRALELQHKNGDARDFNLRNFEVDFETLDEVGSTDDSRFRVELLTPGQFNFAVSTAAGLEFRPEMLTAFVDSDTGIIDYSVDGSGEISLSQDIYESGIKALLPLVDLMMDVWVTTSRGFAVRMALQGGLEEFARDLDFDPDSNKFSGATNRELAPMFEAIFEAAPAGYEPALEYLTGWNQILSFVLADYVVDGSGNIGGAAVGVDQKFVMQMLLPAYEQVGIDMDLRAVLNTLRIEETLLIDHDSEATEVIGTNRGDYIYMSGGDQLYQGGGGADTYFVGADFGNDTIESSGFTADDELRFSYVSSEDVVVRREGTDLILTAEGQAGTLTIKDHFLGEANAFVGQKQLTKEMSSIVFSDGVVWDPFLVAMAVADPRETDDVIVGSPGTDVLIGDRGNDVMVGGLGDDIYVYRVGDGVDVIRERENGPVFTDWLKGGFDNLVFIGDIGADDVRLTRAGESSDLVIQTLDAEGNPDGGQITIEEHFGGIRWNIDGFIGMFDQATGTNLNSEFNFDYVGPSIIEQITFEDGSSLAFEDMAKRVIENARTDGEDAIYGFISTDTLDGGAGDDLLTARGGGDTYIYGVGYGLDVIHDADVDSLGLFGAPDDHLVFTDDLRWTDFEYEREGASDTLHMRLEGTDDGVILKDFLEYSLTTFMWTNRIETFTFGDGTQWSWTKLLQTFVDAASTDGDDVIYGFLTSDRLDGGLGDDALIGLGGNDSYVYGLNYGNDNVLDSGGNDRLLMEGIALEDVTILREGLDLIFEVKATGERVRLENQYLRDNKQGHAVEQFEFEAGDGQPGAKEVISYRDLNPEDVDVIGTSASETLYGSDFSEILDGLGGDDTLIGGSDGDTYLFDVGYGADVIVDTQKRTVWEGRQGREVETADRVVFGDDITTANVIFSKDGDDLLISVQDRSDTLRIRDQFRNITDGVELFEFQDGTIWHISDIEELLQIVGGNRGDNEIVGLLDQENVLDGRQGDDTLIGGNLGDTYAFGAGYDFDTIIERPQSNNGAIDRVVFGSAVEVEALVLRRNGDDLIIDIGNATDVLTIQGGLAANAVEEFHF